MPSITEQSAWAEASHVILLISGSEYFRIKAEFMKKAHSHSGPGLQAYLDSHVYQDPWVFAYLGS